MNFYNETFNQSPWMPGAWINYPQNIWQPIMVRPSPFRTPQIFDVVAAVDCILWDLKNNS